MRFDTRTFEPGPYLHRVPGRMFPRKESDPHYFQFDPWGYLEGFELWLPDLIQTTHPHSLIEMRVDLRFDNRIVDFDKLVARFRSAEFTNA